MPRLVHLFPVVLAGWSAGGCFGRVSSVVPFRDAGDGGDFSFAGGTATGDTSAAGDTSDPQPLGALVRINELVLHPVADWNDSSGGGTPYDETPGDGSVSTLDELIELFNAGSESVSVRDWSLEVRDVKPETTFLDTHGSLWFTAGSSLDALHPGHFLVVGNPVGYSSPDVYVVLRDGSGEVVDDVEVGGLSADRDMEGDGVGDGAPDASTNGFARGMFEEAIARPAGAADTGDDQADFVKMAATPGLANQAPSPPVGTGDLEVTSRSPESTVAVTEAIWVEFDDPLLASSADGAVSVTVGGIPTPLDLPTYEAGDRRLVINPVGRLPFDSVIEITIQGGPTGISNQEGNGTTADVTFQLQSEVAPTDPATIRINEICVSPWQNWGNDEGGDGLPFSATPGTAIPTYDDQWVELLSKSPVMTDLSDYTLTIFAGYNLSVAARVSTRLADAATVRIYGTGSGIDAVDADDRVIIGNPLGAILPHAVVLLRDGAGQLIDMVEIGGTTDELDRGGDGINNGAPGPGEDGSSTSSDDEVLARIPDGADTGDDVTDWQKTAASLGATNL